jgi:hypothetical protein
MGHLLEIKCVDSRVNFIFNKGPIYTHDGASTKFSIKSHEADYSAMNSFLKGSVVHLVFRKRASTEEVDTSLSLRTVIRFVSKSAKFWHFTVVGLNGTLVQAKIRSWDT